MTDQSGRGQSGCLLGERPHHPHGGTDNGADWTCPGIEPFPTITGRVLTAVKVTRKPTKAGQRVWFSCPTCGGYGDASGSLDATEWVVERFTALHLDAPDGRCQP